MSVRRLRPRIDVAALPDTAFGVRDIMWWGTLGFVVITVRHSRCGWMPSMFGMASFNLSPI